MVVKQLIILHIFDPREQLVVTGKIIVRLRQPRGQRFPRIPVLGGKGRHRLEPGIGIVNACGGAMLVLVLMQGFGFLYEAMADLRRPVGRRVPRRPHGPAVELRCFYIPAILVGLLAAKG